MKAAADWKTVGDAREWLLARLYEALAPPARISVSEHATKFRILPDDEAEPGNWKNERTPYLIEIMDRLGPYDDCRELVLMKGAQLGGTEAILNALLYWIEHAPGRILCILPGEDEAKTFSRERLQKMIDNTPALQNLLAPKKRTGAGRPRGDSVFHKEFPGGSLKLTGSNAPAGLRSKPARYILGDEVDGWAFDSGGEGCPLLIAEKRLGTFPGRKAVYVSTPGNDPSRIERRFLAGDQRLYHVPCPDCGKFFLLEFSEFVIPEIDGVKVPSESYMRCPNCKAQIDEWHKEKMLAGGEWRPQRPYNGFRRSYRLPAWYSPLGWLSWGQIADDWLRAQDNPLELKVTINTVFAETYRGERGDTLDESELMATREDWGVRAPARILVVTAGIDVQGDRLAVEIVGWARGYESWSLDYLEIPGDPLGEQIWNDLDVVLKSRFELDDGSTISISAKGIDNSYEPDRVFAYTKRRKRQKVWPLRGATDEARVKREVWPLDWRKSKKRGASGRFKLVGTSTAKRHIYNWLAKPGDEPGPGRCHFPIDRPLPYFQELTAERLITKWRKGFRWVEWEKDPSQPNEALDCRVYGYAVLIGMERAGFSWEEAQIRREQLLRRLDGAGDDRQDREARETPPERFSVPRLGM